MEIISRFPSLFYPIYIFSDFIVSWKYHVIYDISRLEVYEIIAPIAGVRDELNIAGL